MSNRINFSFYFLLILGVLIFIFNIKSSILNGYFFISLNVLIIYSFIISFNIIKDSKFIYVIISIASISFSLLSFDLLTYIFSSNLVLEKQNSDFKVIEGGNFSSENKRVYSNDIPSGYLIKDGKYKSKKSYFEDS